MGVLFDTLCPCQARAPHALAPILPAVLRGSGDTGVLPPSAHFSSTPAVWALQAVRTALQCYPILVLCMVFMTHAVVGRWRNRFRRSSGSSSTSSSSSTSTSKKAHDGRGRGRAKATHGHVRRTNAQPGQAQAVTATKHAAPSRARIRSRVRALFTSSPAAAPTPVSPTGEAPDRASAPQVQIDEAPHARPPPTLLVCTKCRRKGAAPSCSLPPDHPAASTDTMSEAETAKKRQPNPRSGQVLYDAVRAHPRVAELAAAGALRVTPVQCLAYCDFANCVALRAPDKFAYQFAALREDDADDIEDLVKFADQYATKDGGRWDAFSKVKTRPPRLADNCVARIPPLEGPSTDRVTGQYDIYGDPIAG